MPSTTHLSNKASIRPIQSADIPDLIRIWNKTLVQDTTTESRFTSWLFANRDFDPTTCIGAYVAEYEGRPVGFARAYIRCVPNDSLGLEEKLGWIPCIFVDPSVQRCGIGTQLMKRCLDYFRENSREKIWVCGNTGSAPGYLFPGVDKDRYEAGLAFFLTQGFVVDHESVAMSGSLLEWNHERYEREAWKDGDSDVSLQTLDAKSVQPFLAFLQESFPGDWNEAARQQMKSGRWNSVLLAWLGNRVVGYCQWEGDHFGPFGVHKEIRNRGIGAKLFVEAAARIKANDGRTVWFNWADERVQPFYERYGLRATRRFAILRKDLSQ